jgi:hypothetical protein
MPRAELSDGLGLPSGRRSRKRSVDLPRDFGPFYRAE